MNEKRTGEEPTPGREERVAPESDLELREFIDHAPLGLRFVSRDGRILWANQTELSLVGCTETEYIGRDLSEFLVERGVSGELLGRLVAGERIEDHRALLRSKDGTIRQVLIDGSALFRDGRFVHARTLTRDITAFLEKERAARHRVEETSRLKDEFLALLSPRAAGATGYDPVVARAPPPGRARSCRNPARHGNHGAQRSRSGAHHRRFAPRLPDRRGRAPAHPAARGSPERGRGGRGSRLGGRRPQRSRAHVVSWVRHVIEHHGGRVDAASRGPGRGTTITALLPQASGAGVAEGTPSVSSEAVSGGDGRLAGLKVLLVDDEKDAREALRRILDQNGMLVTAAGSAQEAFELVERLQPDILLSDVAMPGEDGLSLIRRVRLLPLDRGGRIPAAALSAYAGVEDRRKALLAGFQYHIPKPVDPDHLLAVIAALARTREAPK